MPETTKPQTKPETQAQASAGFAARCAASPCRSCGHQGLTPVLDLGAMPPSDRLLSPQMLDEPEPRFPLEVAFCESCTLMQILETVDPELLFGEHYLYYSSFSDSLLEHARRNTAQLIQRQKLDAQSFVVELASNDGYLLRHFVDANIPVLGIDPAPAQARAANEAGVETRCEFFSKDMAQNLVAERGHADVVIANNVVAHVADTNGFVAGIATLLKDDGVAAIEVPYVRELIDNCEFDTIYHEHLCYFSVTALDALFRRHGLFLNDLEHLPIHGGSLRLYVEKHERPQPAVRAILQREQADGLTRPDYYSAFADRVQQVRDELRTLLGDIRARGQRIAGYGAAAKGTIMLNYTLADDPMLEFVADRNVHKQGCFMPGVRVPIVDPAQLLEKMPDYTLILPWNFRDEIVSQQTEYQRRGGKFITPIPRPEVLPSSV